MFYILYTAWDENDNLKGTKKSVKRYTKRTAATAKETMQQRF